MIRNRTVAPKLPMAEIFGRNLRFAAGVAPTLAYMDDLAPLIADGTFEPSVVLTETLPIERTDEAYRLMDERMAIKVLLTAEGVA